MSSCVTEDAKKRCADLNKRLGSKLEIGEAVGS
jgi:hypothetical protein